VFRSLGRVNLAQQRFGVAVSRATAVIDPHR
jgi:hypothetical protein